MPTEWSNPLLFTCFGMILGAFALVLLWQIGNSVRPKRSRRTRQAAPDERSFAQVAPQITQTVPLHPRRVPDRYYHWMNLSEREKEIAQLVAQDKSNPEIAEQLSISRFTVANHLRHIYEKLDIKSRQQLTRLVQHIVDYERDAPT